MTDLFPDKSILSIEPKEKQSNWRMYFDGTVNVYGCGIGAVLISLAGAHYSVAVKSKSPCTNNMAEYEACIAGVETSIDMNIKDLEAYGDLTLIISQSTGEWE